MAYKPVTQKLFLFLAGVANGFSVYCPNRLPVKFSLTPPDASDYQSTRVYLHTPAALKTAFMSGSSVTEMETEYVDVSHTYLIGLDGTQSSFTFSVRCNFSATFQFRFFATFAFWNFHILQLFHLVTIIVFW